MARILVVDDEPGLREFVRITLEQEGHEVEEAKDGHEALAVCERAPVDLALVDLVMPGKDGVKTIEELRQRYPRTGIVVITGTAPVRWPLRLLYEQPDTLHMLVKPLKPEVLLDTVAEALGATSR
ncbi:MAG TPA: response regulator [Planctomycetota bacterium]|nr:response regulator [Planctomycetota bacterium]